MDDNIPPKTHSEGIFDIVDWDIESIIDQVWTDLNGQISWSKISTTVVRLLREYDDATIRQYVPVVTRRKARELLRSTADEE